MNLGRLIYLHKIHSTEDSLPFLLFDGVALKHSALYQKVRDLVLESGYELTCEDSLKQKAYAMFPISMLNELYKDKKIYYRDAVGPTIELLRLNPVSSAVDITGANPFTRQTVFHESIHCFANHFCFNNQFPYTVTEALEKKFIIDSYSMESTAISLEFFIGRDLTTPPELAGEPEISEFLTYNANNEKYNAALNEVSKSIGNWLAFLWIFHLAFFMNFNISTNELSAKLMSAIKDHIFKNGVDKKIEEQLYILAAQGPFKINPRFRTSSNELYLRSCGINKDLKTVLDFDIETEVFSKKALVPYLEKLKSLNLFKD